MIGSTAYIRGSNIRMVSQNKEALKVTQKLSFHYIVCTCKLVTVLGEQMTNSLINDLIIDNEVFI